MAQFSGVTGSAGGHAGYPYQVGPTVERWHREGRHLGPNPPHTFAGGSHALSEAIAEARQLKLGGDIAQLFLLESWEGRIAPSQFENATEAGLLDEVLKPLTLPLSAIFPTREIGPGSTSVHVSTPPKGGVGPGGIHTENQPGIGEATQKAVGAIGGLPWLQIIEVVGGAAMVIFGLTVLAQRIKG